jgi:hypothetical protein
MTTTETPAAEIARLRQTVTDATDRMRAIGRSLPPLTLEEVRRLANDDHTLRTDVTTFMRRRFDGIDVTLLSKDPEAWERIHTTGDHLRFRVVEHAEDRYEVRELDSGSGFLLWDLILCDGEERFEVADTYNYNIEAAREDADDAAKMGNQNVYWTVRDNEGDDGPVDGVVFDEDGDANDLAAEKNEREDESLHGFPFAWNHGYCYNDGTLYHNWHAALERAGFLVYRYVGPDGDGDEVICGIDGGGYDFMSAHYAVFYGILAAQNDWLIETSDGPRLVTLD